MINIFSYIFSILLIVTSILLILSRNPVHCIFYFIFCIFNLSGLFLLIHVEYLAVIFLLVYVGAIAVLFLFVVMMLNIKIMDMYELRIRYIPLGLFICFLLFIELYLLILVNVPISITSNIYYINWVEKYTYVSNVEAIGLVLYTYYIMIFLFVSLLLLLGMIAAISLTFVPSLRIKRQASYQQIERKLLSAIYIVK